MKMSIHYKTGHDTRLSTPWVCWLCTGRWHYILLFQSIFRKYNSIRGVYQQWKWHNLITIMKIVSYYNLGIYLVISREESFKWLLKVHSLIPTISLACWQSGSKAWCYLKKEKKKEQRPWVTWSKRQTQWLSKHPVFLFYQLSEANTPQEAATAKTSGTACVWLQL